MNVTLYMAISANGYIARKNDETSWSDEEWKAFNKKANQIGTVLIGRRTYELMKNNGSMDELPCSLIMVLTSKKDMVREKRVVFVNSFSEAITKARNHGVKKLLVAGGSKTNAAALESGKVDEVYLDVEPWLMGSGLPLFTDLIKDFKLKLMETKKIGENGIQLHYKVR